MGSCRDWVIRIVEHLDGAVHRRPSHIYEKLFVDCISRGIDSQPNAEI